MKVSISLNDFAAICLAIMFMGLAGCISTTDAPEIQSIVTLTQPVTVTLIPEVPGSLPDLENNSQTSTPTYQLSDNTPQIEIWHSMDGDQRLALKQVIHNFENANPQFKINLRYVPLDDLLLRSRTAAQTQEMPNMIIGPGELGPTLYAEGLIADLRTDISSDFLRNFNQPALGSVEYKSAVIGFPYTISGVVLYRNQEIIPSAPKTYSELITYAKAATHGDIVGAYLERGDIFAIGQMGACGTSLMFANGLPAFNTPEGLCWLEFLQSFSDAGPTSFNSNQDILRFTAKKTGIIIDGTWNIENFKETLGLNLNIDPWPKFGKRQLSGYVWSENIYLTAAQTDYQKQNSLALTMYLTSSETQNILSTWNLIPAITNLEVPSTVISQAMKALERGTTYPSNPQFQVYFDPINTALDTVYRGETDPQIALQNANDEITGIVQRYLDEIKDRGE